MIVGGLIFAAFFALALLVMNWCVRDAHRRGKSGFLVFVAVFFFFPWGWIAWLIFRPDPIRRARLHDRYRYSERLSPSHRLDRRNE